MTKWDVFGTQCILTVVYKNAADMEKWHKGHQFVLNDECVADLTGLILAHLSWLHFL